MRVTPHVAQNLKTPRLARASATQEWPPLLGIGKSLGLGDNQMEEFVVLDSAWHAVVALADIDQDGVVSLEEARRRAIVVAIGSVIIPPLILLLLGGSHWLGTHRISSEVESGS